jgi:hypothetical protein
MSENFTTASITWINPLTNKFFEFCSRLFRLTKTNQRSPPNPSGFGGSNLSTTIGRPARIAIRIIVVGVSFSLDSLAYPWLLSLTASRDWVQGAVFGEAHHSLMAPFFSMALPERGCLVRRKKTQHNTPKRDENKSWL